MPEPSTARQVVMQALLGDISNVPSPVVPRLTDATLAALVAALAAAHLDPHEWLALGGWELEQLGWGQPRTRRSRSVRRFHVVVTDDKEQVGEKEFPVYRLRPSEEGTER